MARTSRLLVPNCAYHVLHRGYRREPVFLSNEDFACYLCNLRDLAARHDCRIHAYCLMLNHVHLLVRVGEDPASLARLMHQLAARQAQHTRRKYGRCTPLWEERFRSSPVAPELVLPVVRYIEVNPLRAGLELSAERYRWSSGPQHLGMEELWIEPDTSYVGLAPTASLRAERYREHLGTPVAIEEWEMIRSAIVRTAVTGGPDFVRVLESRLGRRLALRPRGRPRRAELPPAGVLADILAVEPAA